MCSATFLSFSFTHYHHFSSLFIPFCAMLYYPLNYTDDILLISNSASKIDKLPPSRIAQKISGYSYLQAGFSRPSTDVYTPRLVIDQFSTSGCSKTEIALGSKRQYRTPTKSTIIYCEIGREALHFRVIHYSATQLPKSR